MKLLVGQFHQLAAEVFNSEADTAYLECVKLFYFIVEFAFRIFKASYH